MNSNILVITNNYHSSLTYTRMLMGYGYLVDEVQTFVGARVRLRAGLIPNIIIVDIKLYAEEKQGFVDWLSANHNDIQVLIIGKTDLSIWSNATVLHRPIYPEIVLDAVQQLNYA